MNYNNILLYLVGQGSSFETALNIILPSIGLFISGIIKGNLLYIILYILVNLLALLLTIIFVSLLYTKINFAFNKSVVKISKKELNYKQTPIFNRLISNETKRYFNIPVYMFNTIVMAIMGCIIPFVIYFSSVSSLGFGTGEGVAMALIIIMITMVTIPSCNTSCSSISIEGPRLETLKSLPIKPEVIIKAKIAFNILLVLPFILFAEIINLILFNEYFSILTALILFVFPVIAVIGSSMFGMLANLYLPKMKYDNYVQVVKQSASSMIGLLGSMLINIAPFILFLSVFINKISITLFLIIDFAYITLFLLIIYSILKAKGAKLFNQITC